MVELNFSVQADRCNHCGLCAPDCPSRIIEQEGQQLPSVSPENAEKCIECQHCLAICPTAAISVFGLNPDDSLAMSADARAGLEQMTFLTRGRRSVRQYREHNVDSRVAQTTCCLSAEGTRGSLDSWPMTETPPAVSLPRQPSCLGHPAIISCRNRQYQ
ncbi:MAG: 4Fe-4S binding protein [Pirellulales bacterium]|nr:4Fe-4S binding protein [Pirellulales bacterium]